MVRWADDRHGGQIRGPQGVQFYTGSFGDHSTLRSYSIRLPKHDSVKVPGVGTGGWFDGGSSRGTLPGKQLLKCVWNIEVWVPQSGAEFLPEPLYKLLELIGTDLADETQTWVLLSRWVCWSQSRGGKGLTVDSSFSHQLPQTCCGNLAHAGASSKPHCWLNCPSLHKGLCKRA